MAINSAIPRANNVKITLVSNLDDWDGVTGPIDKDLRQVVVQKASIGRFYTYALQHVAGDTFVYRGRNGKQVTFDKKRPVLTMTGTAAGHTQTFVYANKLGQWFIGTKPNELNHSRIWSAWSSQIARVNVGHFNRLTQKTKVQPRLTNLNHAGQTFGVGCLESEFARVEAAVSPDYQYFLLAYGDNQSHGYFALYNLADINAALDYANTPSKFVDIASVNCLDAFAIADFSGANGQVGSLQGFDINHYLDQTGANHIDIYLSSQPATDMAGLDRKIIKIPWREKNPAKWELVDLTNESDLEIPGYYTEIEGIQLIAHNQVYLTVAYHQYAAGASLTSHPTKINKIYQVSWQSAG